MTSPGDFNKSTREKKIETEKQEEAENKKKRKTRVFIKISAETKPEKKRKKGERFEGRIRRQTTRLRIIT